MMETYRNQKRIQRLAKQWNVVNTTTIIEWISASNLNILLLNTYLISLRSVLRFNTLWSLVISSVTSTISVTQFTVSDDSNIYLSYGIKILIFLTSVTTSMITGYIKVEKIQETIELLEEHKKNWLSFMYSLTSELQVGMEFRNDATAIINAKKDEFNSVSARQIEIPQYVHKKVSSFLMTKRLVENRIKKAQIQRNEDERITCGLSSCIPGCFTICCCFYWLTYCFKSRCCDKTENDYNMEKIGTKLSLFHTINKELTNELLELMNIFKDEVKGLQFDRRNDMFNYEIINNRYVVDLEAAEQDITLLRLKPDEDACDMLHRMERRASFSRNEGEPILLNPRSSSSPIKERRAHFIRKSSQRRKQKSRRDIMVAESSTPYKPLNKRYDMSATIQNAEKALGTVDTPTESSESDTHYRKPTEVVLTEPISRVLMSREIDKLPQSPETNATSFST